MSEFKSIILSKGEIEITAAAIQVIIKGLPESYSEYPVLKEVLDKLLRANNTLNPKAP